MKKSHAKLIVSRLNSGHSSAVLFPSKTDVQNVFFIYHGFDSTKSHIQLFHLCYFISDVFFLSWRPQFHQRTLSALRQIWLVGFACQQRERVDSAELRTSAQIDPSLVGWAIWSFCSLGRTGVFHLQTG